MLGMTPRQGLLAKTTAPPEEIQFIVRAEHSDPFHVLGAHPVEADGRPGIAIRVFWPEALKAWVIPSDETVRPLPLEPIHPAGFYEAVFPGEARVFPYRLRVESEGGGLREFEDPYRFPPVLTDFDVHLMSEGTHYKTYEKM